MSIVLAFLIGIAVNLDNFLIGMNLGIRGQRLTVLSNLIIGAATGICAFASTYAARLISGNFLVYTNVIGACILILFGVYCLINGFKQNDTPEEFSALGAKDSCILGFVLAINCIPPSFSAGVMNLSPYYVSIFSALLSCICMHVSNRLGNKLVHLHILNYLTPASAILLILIGAFELAI